MKVYGLFLSLLGVLGAGCSQSVALGVSASFRDATGAVVYTGGGGGGEVNAATPPLSGAPQLSAYVNGDGADPIDVESVAIAALTVTAPSGSACAAAGQGCALGVCTASVTWSTLGACAFDVVADTAEGEVTSCVSFAITVAGSGEYAAASAKATAFCAE